MLYYSTNSISEKVDFRQATLAGQAPDGGLYFPERIPLPSKDFFAEIESYSKEEIAFKIIEPYVGDTISKTGLLKIVEETIVQDFPLVSIEEGIYSLELFHGPTLAFKDVGARFMSRCLSCFIQGSDKKITVLVATSGDTGSAVANGFYNVEGVDVVLLYPSGKVSDVQELQLTTYGGNISAIEMDGTFDDCQHLVKQAFADEQLRKDLLLTSANSINVARWLPQQFYYFFAYRQWPHKNSPLAISVPSGNFGNLCAGMLANCSGLPVAHFIASCNANDIISPYFETGNYSPKPSVATISNAMDVGSPSNFVRINELFGNDFKKLKNKLSSYTISDAATKIAIKDVYKNHGYLLDPHGAVGYCGLKKYLANHPEQQGIFLETAHPVKFFDVVEPAIGEKIAMPASITDLYRKEKRSVKMKNDYALFKDFLMAR